LWDRYLEPEFKGRVRITGPFQSRRYIDGRSVSDSDQLPRDRTYSDEAMSAALFTEDPLYRSVFKDGDDDHLIMATDYPHADAAEKFPERTAGDLAKNSNLSETTRRKILWDNPARLYGIREIPNKIRGPQQQAS
jgi:hypothetical protein